MVPVPLNQFGRLGSFSVTWAAPVTGRGIRFVGSWGVSSANCGPRGFLLGRVWPPVLLLCHGGRFTRSCHWPQPSYWQPSSVKRCFDPWQLSGAVRGCACFVVRGAHLLAASMGGTVGLGAHGAALFSLPPTRGFAVSNVLESHLYDVSASQGWLSFCWVVAVSDEQTYLMYSARMNLYKIGYSCDPSRRVAGVANGCPDVRLVQVFPHDRKLEAYLHEAFAAERFGGEWFDLGPEGLARVVGKVDAYLGGRPPRRLKGQPCGFCRTGDHDLCPELVVNGPSGTYWHCFCADDKHTGWEVSYGM